VRPRERPCAGTLEALPEPPSTSAMMGKQAQSTFGSRTLSLLKYLDAMNTTVPLVLSPRPHLRRGWAHPCRIRTMTLPHLGRDRACRSPSGVVEVCAAPRHPLRAGLHAHVALWCTCLFSAARRCTLLHGVALWCTCLLYVARRCTMLHGVVCILHSRRHERARAHAHV
jgi:hypothetical protein